MQRKSLFKNTFTWFLFFFAICLIIAAISLTKLTSSGGLDRNYSLSIFSLLVDIVVGILTIWGLFWAASTFAREKIEPELRLLVTRRGTEENVIPPRETLEDTSLVGGFFLVDDKDHSKGKCMQVPVDLMLENNKENPASHIRIVLTIRCKPSYPLRAGDYCLLNKVPLVYDSKPDKVSLQWGDDPLVYRGSPIWLGGLGVMFPNNDCPKEIIFRYSVFCLQSKNIKKDEKELRYEIKWEENSDDV